MSARTGRDVQSLKILYNFNKILGVIPTEAPRSKNEAKHPSTCSKVLNVVLAIIFVIQSPLSTYCKYRLDGLVDSVMLNAMDALNAFCLVALNLSTNFATNFFHPNAWTRLNSGFAFVEEKLRNKILKPQNFFEKIPVQFALGNAVYFVAVSYISYVSWQTDVLLYMALDAFMYMATWYSLNIFLLVHGILTMFQYKYEDMNALLLADTKDVKTVKVVAAMLKEMTEDFNVLFGHTLLFIACRGVLQLLISISYVLVMNALYSRQLNVNMVIAINVHALLIMLPTILVAAACGRVKSESEKAELLCYKSHMDDGHAPGLAQFLKSHVAKFSAGGLFEVDKSTICGLLTTTVTYLIVLIQFSGK